MSDTQREIGRLLASVDALQRALDRLTDEHEKLRHELHDARQDIGEMRNDWAELQGGKKVALALFSVLGAAAGAVSAWLTGLAK